MPHRPTQLPPAGVPWEVHPSPAQRTLTFIKRSRRDAAARESITRWQVAPMPDASCVLK